MGKLSKRKRKIWKTAFKSWNSLNPGIDLKQLFKDGVLNSFKLIYIGEYDYDDVWSWIETDTKVEIPKQIRDYIEYLFDSSEI